MEPPRVTYRLLKDITGGFSKKNELGWGSYGVVYQGRMPNGDEVAVKKLHDSTPSLDDLRFSTEFDNLTRVQHPNIVRIVGYCYEIEKMKEWHEGRLVEVSKIHRLLCFECLPKGSLQRYLSDYLPKLDWNACYKIIKGICEALKYIHQDLGPAFYHLDVKPGNILLDEKVGAKLADFGLSKVFHEKLTRTTGSKYGTVGYRPPEFEKRNKISEKFDIYSFGVVILQLVTGLEGYPEIDDMPHPEFIDQAQQRWRSMLDRKYRDSLLEAYCNQVTKCIEIGLKCVEDDRTKRPGLDRIIRQLIDTEKRISESNMVQRGKDPMAAPMRPRRAWQTRTKNKDTGGSSRQVYGGKPEVILYTTTLGTRRHIFQACKDVREALNALNIKFEERNLFDRNDHQRKLKELTKSQHREVPVLSINDNYIADGPTLLQLCNEGSLAELFE